MVLGSMNFAQFIRGSRCSDTMNALNRLEDVNNLSKFRVIQPKLSKQHRIINEDVDPPIERSGHRMLCDNDYVYIVGGYCPYYSEQLIEEIWRFNILTEEWELINVEGDEFPAEMASFCICTEFTGNWNQAFLFGGTTVPFGNDSSNRITVLQKLKNRKFKWKSIKVIGPEPIREYGSAMLMHNGVLYQIGGTTGHEYNMEARSLTPVWESDNAESLCEPDYWKWDLLNEGGEEFGRYRHEIEIIGDELIIIGGGNPRWASTLEELLIFNIRTKKFMKRAIAPDESYGYPAPRMCHSCVKFNENIYVIGGCSEKRRVAVRRRGQIEVSDLYDDVWELDTKNWRWRKLEAKLHNKTCFHDAVVTQNGCIYVFGGVVDGAFTRRCNVMQSIWLCVPSLQHFCMKAIVSKYGEQLQQFPHDFTISKPVVLGQSVFEALLLDTNDGVRSSKNTSNNKSDCNDNSVSDSDCNSSKCDSNNNNGSNNSNDNSNDSTITSSGNYRGFTSYIMKFMRGS